MEYGEYRFRAEMLLKKRARETKNSMIAASFTAWQIISSQGGKVPWEKYLRMVGLAEKEVLSRDEVNRTMAIAKNVLARQGIRSSS